MPVSKEELDAWLQHPVTKELRAMLARKRLEEMEAWAQGFYMRDTEIETAVEGAAAVARCKVFQTLLDIIPEDLNE